MRVLALFCVVLVGCGPAHENPLAPKRGTLGPTDPVAFGSLFDGDYVSSATGSWIRIHPGRSNALIILPSEGVRLYFVCHAHKEGYATGDLDHAEPDVGSLPVGLLIVYEGEPRRWLATVQYYHPVQNVFVRYNDIMEYTKNALPDSQVATR